MEEEEEEEEEEGEEEGEVAVAGTMVALDRYALRSCICSLMLLTKAALAESSRVSPVSPSLSEEDPVPPASPATGTEGMPTFMDSFLISSSNSPIRLVVVG